MRENVLVETIEQVLAQYPAPEDVLVVDQTPTHAEQTESRLREWQGSGKIRWLRGLEPNLPGARNVALREARTNLVIFVDDDVLPSPGFVETHRRCYKDPSVFAVTGQVLGPDRKVAHGVVKDYSLRFPRNYHRRSWIRGLFGCNFSVRRDFAIDLGGFDMRYTGSAYREESDFAFRATAKTGRLVLFEPEASLIHLAEGSGGCRAWGGIYSIRELSYSRGDYYFALCNLPLFAAVLHVALRPYNAIAQKYPATHPWVIPLLLVREVIAFTHALYMVAGGRRLIWCEP